jgi:hypothetical protein
VGSADKPLVWLRGEIKTPPFSAAARVEAGVLLRRLQRGEKLALPRSRPTTAADGSGPTIRPPGKEGTRMNKTKRAKLRARGWVVGTAEGFLGLSAAEAAVVELKLALSASLRTRRRAQRLTQAALAKRLGSSQSRVAKMEAGDRSVSLDLLVRSLAILGATPRDIARALTKPPVAA